MSRSASDAAGRGSKRTAEISDNSAGELRARLAKLQTRRRSCRTTMTGRREPVILS